MTLRGDTTLSGSGPLHLGAGASLDNEGDLTADSGTTFDAGTCCANPDRFTNGGTLTVAGGKKPVSFSLLAFVNTRPGQAPSGKLVVIALSYTQTAGVTDLAGRVVQLEDAGPDQGRHAGRAWPVGAAVVNGGTVSPSTTGGVLTVNGSYQQTKSGTFATVAGTGPEKFGQLVVEGAAKLAGTIKVSTSTTFKPKKGQSFQVMRYRSHTGSFGKKTRHPEVLGQLLRLGPHQVLGRSPTGLSAT